MKYLKGVSETLDKYRSWNSKYHQSLLAENEIFLASPSCFNKMKAGVTIRLKKEIRLGNFIKWKNTNASMQLNINMYNK